MEEDKVRVVVAMTGLGAKPVREESASKLEHFSNALVFKLFHIISNGQMNAREASEVGSKNDNHTMAHAPRLLPRIKKQNETRSNPPRPAC